MEDIFLPVVEASVVLASHYAKACGRDTVTAKDVELGLMFAARNVVGKQLGSLYPEIYDENSSDEEEEEIQEVDEDDEPFTRYTGTEELYVKMNECLDSWDDWEPETPAEHALKNSVNKIRQN